MFGGVSVLCLASRTRCKWPMETSRNKVITSKTVIRSSSVIRSQLGEMFDQWKVSLYIFMYECHVTFGRGRLQNV